MELQWLKRHLDVSLLLAKLLRQQMKSQMKTLRAKSSRKVQCGTEFVQGSVNVYGDICFPG